MFHSGGGRVADRIYMLQTCCFVCFRLYSVSISPCPTVQLEKQIAWSQHLSSSSPCVYPPGGGWQGRGARGAYFSSAVWLPDGCSHWFLPLLSPNFVFVYHTSRASHHSCNANLMRTNANCEHLLGLKVLSSHKQIDEAL